MHLRPILIAFLLLLIPRPAVLTHSLWLTKSPRISPFLHDEDSYTVVVEEDAAREAGINPDELYTRIDLGSSTELAAIGITASIAQILGARSITANFIASRRHDHLFVQPDRAQEATALLEDLGRRAKGWLPA